MIQMQLTGLPQRHVLALRWFALTAGSIQRWPKPLDDGTLLVTQAKGIYKPEWSDYALSVRQTLNSPYPDQEPVVEPSGRWTYRYFQERAAPPSASVAAEGQDKKYTNRGLMACMQRGVPVGIMRQTKGKPGVQYRILGLAAVKRWDKGFFEFQGLSREELQDFLRYSGPADSDLAAVESSLARTGEFDPASFLDERKRVLAAIVRRQGQSAFRQALLVAYEGRCAICGQGAKQSLEAAHIVPFVGPATNTLANGLLLRSDIHTLFDLGLIAVSPVDRVVWVSPLLEGTEYEKFRGQPIRRPLEERDSPSAAALAEHWRASGLGTEVSLAAPARSA
jgi:hypothetical protein